MFILTYDLGDVVTTSIRLMAEDKASGTSIA